MPQTHVLSGPIHHGPLEWQRPFDPPTSMRRQPCHGDPAPIMRALTIMGSRFMAALSSRLSPSERVYPISASDRSRTGCPYGVSPPILSIVVASCAASVDVLFKRPVRNVRNSGSIAPATESRSGGAGETTVILRPAFIALRCAAARRCVAGAASVVQADSEIRGSGGRTVGRPKRTQTRTLAGAGRACDRGRRCSEGSRDGICGGGLRFGLRHPCSSRCRDSRAFPASTSPVLPPCGVQRPPGQRSTHAGSPARSAGRCERQPCSAPTLLQTAAPF